MPRPPPRFTRSDTLCPYSTLFRAWGCARRVSLLAIAAGVLAGPGRLLRGPRRHADDELVRNAQVDGGHVALQHAVVALHHRELRPRGGGAGLGQLHVDAAARSEEHTLNSSH